MVTTLDGGGTTGPFSRYPVTPDSVWAAGDRVASYAGNVETLRGDVTTAHRPAPAGVAGLLADPMVTAQRPVQERTQRWLRSALFAGGAVRLFGDAVSEYNRKVDDLNRRYWDAKHSNFGLTAETLAADATPAERSEADDSFRSAVATADRALLAELRRELHQVVEPGLDDEADHVARLLDRGPDDEAAVVELYAAGTLPWTTPLLFPGYDFTGVPTQLPPGVSGTDAAETIRRALDGDASPEEFQEAMLLLQIVTDRAEQVSEDGGHLTTAELNFLNNFYNELGDRIWDVPDYINRDSHSWDAPWLNPFGLFDKDASGFDGDTQEWMLASMGTGLLALSNNQLWPPHLRDHDPMEPDSRYHLPETVIDLVTQPALDRAQLVQYPHLGPMVDRWDDFQALAQMLEHVPPDIEAGTRFSEQTTIRVAELAAGGQIYQDSGTPGLLTSTPLFFADQVSEVLGPILEVSTRNDEANYRLLTGQATGEYVQLNRQADLTDQQWLLASLYGFEWSDDGATAAGLTDWIGERADAAARDGEYDPWATEAAAALIDLVTATEQGEGHDGSGLGPDGEPLSARVDMYDRLMADLSERNPEIARSFGRVAASYLADFAEPSGPETTVEGNGSLSLSDHDKVRFLDLIATDEAAINGVSLASGEYQQRLLAAALTDDERSIIDVGQQSSRLDGLLAAARVNAGIVTGSQQYENELAAYEEHMRWANYGKTAGTTVAGTLPIGPYLNAGLGILADEVIDGAIPAPERDAGYHPGDILDLGRDETYAAHEYLTAMIANDQLPDDPIPAMFLETAPPYPGAPFETPVYEDGRPVLKPVHELQGSERQELFLYVGHENTGIGGDDFARYYNDYEASGDFQRSVARDGEAHRQGLR